MSGLKIGGKVPNYIFVENIIFDINYTLPYFKKNKIELLTQILHKDVSINKQINNLWTNYWKKKKCRNYIKKYNKINKKYPL